MADQQDKCRVEDGKHVIPCRLLSDAVEHNSYGGVTVWRYSNVKDAEPTRTFFGVKSGAYRSSGIVFNFCPFCGEPIDTPVRTNKDE